MRRLTLLMIALVVLINTLKSQESELNNVDTGIGLGLNYGGIGCSVAFVLTPYISIEGNCGFNLLDLVGGGALNIYIVPKNNTKFYSLAFKGSYGYNTAIIEVHENFDVKSRSGESFYGLSLGLINEFRFGRNKRNGFNIGIIAPIRTTEFYNSYDEMFDTESGGPTIYPLLLSIGLHFEFKR